MCPDTDETSRHQVPASSRHRTTIPNWIVAGTEVLTLAAAIFAARFAWNAANATRDQATTADDQLRLAHEQASAAEAGAQRIDRQATEYRLDTRAPTIIARASLPVEELLMAQAVPAQDFHPVSPESFTAGGSDEAIITFRTRVKIVLENVSDKPARVAFASLDGGSIVNGPPENSYALGPNELNEVTWQRTVTSAELLADGGLEDPRRSFMRVALWVWDMGAEVRDTHHFNADLRFYVRAEGRLVASPQLKSPGPNTWPLLTKTASTPVSTLTEQPTTPVGPVFTSSPAAPTLTTMYEARSTTAGRVFSAEQFEALDPALRSHHRESLTCTGCGAPAYFIRTAQNGRAACFGARPHGDDCEMASTDGEDSAPGSLEDADTIVATDSVFVLQPSRSRAITHVTEVDDDAGHAHRSCRRHTGPEAERTTRKSLALNKLLRRLVREPKFRRSKVALVVPDGTSTTIRKFCVPASTVDASRGRPRRLYWDYVSYVHEDTVRGGAWLNMRQKGSPGIRLNEGMLASVKAAKKITDTGDLAGCSFLYYGALTRKAKTGKHYFSPQDPEWFIVRLAGQDADR